MLQTQHDDNIEESDSDFEDEEEEDAIQASLVLQIVSRDSDGSANVKVFEASGTCCTCVTNGGHRTYMICWRNMSGRQI